MNRALPAIPAETFSAPTVGADRFASRKSGFPDPVEIAAASVWNTRVLTAR
jgi:hypothetical protein